MIRTLRAGDRVMNREDGRVMEIIKYINEDGSPSDHHVVCIWYEEGERKQAFFDQRTLFKVSEVVPISHGK